MPRIIFVNKMDRENADFDSILDNLRGKFGKHVLPLQLPLGKEENFQGIIDLYKMKAYRANGNGSDEIEIPDEYKEAAAAALVAATSEINKAATKGVYHKNTSSRKISRLNKAVNKMA